VIREEGDPMAAILPSADDAYAVKANDAEHVLVAWKKRGGDRGPEITHADGVYFYDAEGRRYLDFTSGFVFNNFGYGERRVVDAIARQAQTLPVVASPFVTAPRSIAAAKLAALTPGDLGAVFFSCGGAEANEVALKMARDLTGRPLLCSRYHSFHGATYGAITVSRDPRSWSFDHGLADVVYAPTCDPYRCRYAPPGGRHDDCGEHCADELEEVLLQHNPARVAGIILEPIVGSNGLIIPADGYLQRVRAICDRYGIVLIADEVMTGFGRTGRWFAIEHWDVVPDVMTLSKGLTGGYVPMGATVVRDALARFWDDRPLIHGYTFSGHALGCAAAWASLDVYRDDRLIERSAEQGAYLLGRARELMERHPSVGDVRGKGLFVGMELVYDRAAKRPMHDPVTLARTAVSPKDRVIAQAMREGVYIMNGMASVLMMCPPLTITREQIDAAIEVIDRALAIADAQVDGG
jgi:taurine---2-oxoglutarate transaminase